MTPHKEDLICDLTDSTCVVEVATGVLTRAPKIGTAKIRTDDINTGDCCYVLVHNVLYVPGLNKRLLSVRQWNLNGSNILFELDRCLISVYDPSNNQNYSYEVQPPYSSTIEDLHTPSSSMDNIKGANAVEVRTVDSSLLHKY